MSFCFAYGQNSKGNADSTNIETAGGSPANKTKDKQNIKRPIIVAHRGASRHALENTIPAFKLAWEKGADAIEGDFRLTKDGHIVCVHDGDTKRIAGKKLVVAQSTFKELRNLVLGYTDEEETEKILIPTIEEFLATVPDKTKQVYIEIKCGVTIIPKMLEAIKNSGLKDNQITIISFNTEVIRQFKKKAPQYKYNWLCSLKRDENGTLNPSLDKVLETLDKIGANGFSSSANNINRKFIESIISKEYEYHVWTIDNVRTAQKFNNWGVSSITTNFPKIIKDSINN